MSGNWIIALLGVLSGLSLFPSAADAQRFRCGTQVRDIDGNLYATVPIGRQCWTASNLRAVRFANGDSIAHVPDDRAWGRTSAPAWSLYANDGRLDLIYGKLYNGETAMDPRNPCPAGFRVPTDDDWTTLSKRFRRSAGGALKALGTDRWSDPNLGATNESGFTALPGGFRALHGPFMRLEFLGIWWSSTPSDDDNVWTRNLYNNSDLLVREDSGRRNGYSIRCVR